MQSATTKTPPSGSQLRYRLRPFTGSTGSHTEQAEVSTTGVVADGFLKHRFMPIYEVSPVLPKCSTVTHSLLKSVRYAAQYYGVQLIDVKPYQYPHNVLLALWDLERKIRKKGRYRNVKVIQDDEGKISLSVTETLNMNNTLFYIPVEGLYKLCQSPQHQATANLLTAVFSYLYIHAGVCYYRDEGTYLEYNYDMMNDWIEDDRELIDDDHYKRNRTALDLAAKMGDFIQERIMDKSYLEACEAAIENFVPHEDYEYESLRIARAFFELWVKHPDNNIFSHANHPDVKRDEDDDEYYDNDSCIGLGDYISFIADDSSCIYDEIFTMINNDFNERPAMQEPEIEILFDTPKGLYNDQLAYEDQLFDLIGDLCDLCDLLNKLP